MRFCILLFLYTGISQAATVYADGTGNILGISRTFTDIQTYFVNIPTGTVTTLDFDETLNSNLLTDLLNNQNQYTLTTGPVLRKAGVIQTIVGGGISSTAWRNALTAANAVTPTQIQAAITALIAGSATSAQQQTAIAYILIKMTKAGLLF